MKREFNNTINPLLVNFIALDANATTIKSKVKNKEHIPKGEGSINSSKTFYFARVSSYLEHYPATNKKSINTPLFIEIYCQTADINQSWCRDQMRLSSNGIIHNGQKTYKGWYLATQHDSTLEGQIKNLHSSNPSIKTNYTIATHPMNKGKIKDIQTSYILNELEKETKAEIEIHTDIWLRFNKKDKNKNASYFVTIKPISGMAGIHVDSDNNSNLGYNLMRDKKKNLNGILEKNGKMSW